LLFLTGMTMLCIVTDRHGIEVAMPETAARRRGGIDGYLVASTLPDGEQWVRPPARPTS
jgi:hypothetical protein